MTLLPDKLISGMAIRLPTGSVCLLVRTKKKDDHDQPLFRLHFPAQAQKGVRLPAVKANGLYSRDVLQEMGARIEE